MKGKKRKVWRGGSLIETVVSLFIIGTASAAAIGLVIMSLNMSKVAEERIIALNLAREGLEAVRSVRDTNWLENPGERRENWNLTGSGVSPEFIDEGKSYRVEFGDDFRWSLTSNSVGLSDDLGSGSIDDDEFFRLARKEMGTGEGEVEVYKHLGVSDDCLESDGCRKTYFYREVKFDYLQDPYSGDEYGHSKGPGYGGILEVRVRVVWWTGSRAEDVELVTYLTDFLGRKYDING